MPVVSYGWIDAALDDEVHAHIVWCMICHQLTVGQIVHQPANPVTANLNAIAMPCSHVDGHALGRMFGLTRRRIRSVQVRHGRAVPDPALHEVDLAMRPGIVVLRPEHGDQLDAVRAGCLEIRLPDAEAGGVVPSRPGAA